MIKRRLSILLLLILLLTLLAACGAAPASTVNTAATEASATAPATAASEAAASEAEGVTRPAGWAEASHGDSAAPNYAVVFPQDTVNQLTITIDPADWAAMQANMTELLGEPGQGGQGGFGGQGGPPAPPAGGQPPVGGPPAGGPRPGGGGFGGDLVAENPLWVAATIAFKGQTWTNVGVRYKGNSSLQRAWQSGSLKLPLKLDFDEFEGDDPTISNQRFYGFKQLSLANNNGDGTAMRETVAYDLLEQAGLVAAETAFYEVVVDYGEGPVSLGLYTMVEVIDDTVIEQAFGDDSGNIYEGDGRAVSLAEGSFDGIATSFQKENNEQQSDWSDIEALYNVLHSTTRSSDPAAWRAELETIFDVDSFLEWLAISAAIQHWDTYGQMSHNFYLYNDPATGKLTWISWDHNFVLSSGGGTGGGGMGGGMRGSSSLDKADITASWPLTRYLLDDPTYYARYVASMRVFSDEVFNADALAAKYTALATLLEPYATAESSAESFASAVAQLTSATRERAEAVRSFLATQE
jgi:spore coat protein H